MIYEVRIQRAAGHLVDAVFVVPVAALAMHYGGWAAAAVWSGCCALACVRESYRAWRFRRA